MIFTCLMKSFGKIVFEIIKCRINFNTRRRVKIKGFKNHPSCTNSSDTEPLNPYQPFGWYVHETNTTSVIVNLFFFFLISICVKKNPTVENK